MLGSSANATNYLAEQKKTTDKKLADEWTYIEGLYNDKLWNELTIKLNEFIKHPTLQSEESLLKLYHNFISSFEMKINPYGLTEMVVVIVSYIQDKKEAVAFLDKTKEKVKQCDEAVWFCRVLQGELHLEHLQDLEETKKIIEDLKEVLEVSGNVTPVHGKYFFLASKYYRRIGQHADYYRCGLQFLGCSLESYPKEEWPKQAFMLGLAALIGDGIYNIGELLAHPIVDSLIGTENEWLLDLLKAFNEGNVNKYQDMKPRWTQVADLASNEVLLREKISLLCLMEMTFKRPAGSRSIKFEEIASETQFPIDTVEPLIIKALSQGLVKGSIDQVAGVVNMNWVQPRILTKPQVVAMASILDTWTHSVSSLENLIETKASEILTN